MNQDKAKQKEENPKEAEGLDVKLEGENRGTKTMRQRKMHQNTDDPSSINDDFSLDQNSDPIAAKKQ